MRSEDEVKKRMDVLQKMRQSPCNCKRVKHEMHCEIGDLLLKCALLEIGWVLGDEGYSSFVKACQRLQEKYQSEQN